MVQVRETHDLNGTLVSSFGLLPGTIEYRPSKQKKRESFPKLKSWNAVNTNYKWIHKLKQSIQQIYCVKHHDSHAAFV